MSWPTCPFKFAGGEQCQELLGHEKHGRPHKHEETAVTKSDGNGFRYSGYKLLIESAAPAPRRPRRKR